MAEGRTMERTGATVLFRELRVGEEAMLTALSSVSAN
jgi:hypothetical protein